MMRQGRRQGFRRGGSEESALHSAARSGDLDAVKSILCSNPLAVNNRDEHSRTPLHLAAWAGQTEIVNYLCKNKADAGASAMDDMGAIHFAAQKGHLEVVKALVSYGVSVKSATRRGLTPLHYAAQISNLDLVKYLVKKGASQNAMTKAGKAPIDFATSEEIKLFLQSQSLPTDASDSKGTKPDTDDNKSDAMKSNDDENCEQEEDPCAADEKNVQMGHGEEAEDEISKQKNDPEVQPKRAKITLSHLVSEDDTETI